jgi:hypothetical protein
MTTSSIKAYIRTIRLGKWFPPNDFLAASVARLCILREDFMTELRGIEGDAIPQLDQHSEQWRRMYFLRNSIRTLMEIRSTIETIQRDSEFKKVLAIQPREEQDEFRELIQRMNEAQETVKDLRNAVGGHVGQERIQQSLNEMNYDRFSLLEMGAVLKNTHYKFAGELVAGMFVAGTPENQQIARIESDFQKIAELIFVVHVMDLILLWYVKARGLLS